MAFANSEPFRLAKVYSKRSKALVHGLSVACTGNFGGRAAWVDLPPVFQPDMMTV